VRTNIGIGSTNKHRLASKNLKSLWS